MSTEIELLIYRAWTICGVTLAACASFQIASLKRWREFRQTCKQRGTSFMVFIRLCFPISVFPVNSNINSNIHVQVTNEKLVCCYDYQGFPNPSLLRSIFTEISARRHFFMQTLRTYACCSWSIRSYKHTIENKTKKACQQSERAFSPNSKIPRKVHAGWSIE